MYPEKPEGWDNIYFVCCGANECEFQVVGMYNTRQQAEEDIKRASVGSAGVCENAHLISTNIGDNVEIAKVGHLWAFNDPWMSTAINWMIEHNHRVHELSIQAGKEWRALTDEAYTNLSHTHDLWKEVG